MFIRSIHNDLFPRTSGGKLGSRWVSLRQKILTSLPFYLFIYSFIYLFILCHGVCSPQQIYFFKSRRILLSLSCGSTTKLTIHRFHIDHNKPCFIPAPHPSPLKRQMHNHCFQFLLGIAAKFRGRREGGGGWWTRK